MLKRYGPAALCVVLLAALWEFAVPALGMPHYILPRLSKVLAALWDNRVLLTKHAWVTLGEALLGLALSVACGVLIAAWIHFSGLAKKVVYPLVVASQTIPLIALSPVMVMWFGYEIWSKIAVVVLFTFFPVTVGTIDGFRTVDRDLVDLMRTMGGSRWAIFRKLQVPSALPSFFSGLKVAATFCVGGATIGEWLGAEKGLGMFAKRSSNMLRADMVFASVLVLALMGIALFLLTKWLESRIVRWQDRGDRSA